MFFQGILKRALICNSDNSDIEMPDAFVIVFAHQVADRNFAFCFAFLQFDICFFHSAPIVLVDASLTILIIRMDRIIVLLRLN